jgi:hypothetical protein
MTDETYNIKIVTGGDKKAEIAQSNDPSKTYILLQNEELSNQNKQLIIQLKELETEKNEIDDLADKIDRDKKHMKDFIKTSVHSNNIRKSIVQTYQSLEKHNVYIYYTFQILVIIHFLLIGLAVPSFFLNVYLLSYVSVYPLSREGTKGFADKIDKLNKELSDLEKTNDFLNDYVDNM